MPRNIRIDSPGYPTNLKGASSMRSLPLAIVIAIVGILFLSVSQTHAAKDEKEKGTARPEKPLPLAFEDTFDAGMGRWEPTDANAWKIIDEGGNKILSQFQQSGYKPEVRSPVNIAWTKDLDVGDFSIDVKLRQTGKEYGHRDMCIFFGKQDPTHFYYVHIATKADDHANSIFIVNGEPRKSIATERTTGTDWSTGFHNVRVTRNVESGEITVYFDDMTKPIMKAVDKTFTHGPVGFGTFDDTGDVDDVKIWGKAVQK
jgi:hypothetical protein